MILGSFVNPFFVQELAQIALEPLVQHRLADLSGQLLKVLFAGCLPEIFDLPGHIIQQLLFLSHAIFLQEENDHGDQDDASDDQVEDIIGLVLYSFGAVLHDVPDRIMDGVFQTAIDFPQRRVDQAYDIAAHALPKQGFAQLTDLQDGAVIEYGLDRRSQQGIQPAPRIFADRQIEQLGGRVDDQLVHQIAGHPANLSDKIRADQAVAQQNQLHAGVASRMDDQVIDELHQQFRVIGAIQVTDRAFQDTHGDIPGGRACPVMQIIKHAVPAMGDQFAESEHGSVDGVIDIRIEAGNILVGILAHDPIGASGQGEQHGGIYGKRKEAGASGS
jgi:hypothetical protein